jgi:hypothetical protein
VVAEPPLKKKEVAEVKLYHCTSYYNLQCVLREGITRGDVPTGPTSGFNAVWLTKNPEPSVQAWSRRQPLSDDELKALESMKASGTVRYVETSGIEDWELGKIGITLEVAIPSSDPRLIHWSKFARRHLNPALYRALDETGGGRSRDWYIYRGVVARSRIVKVGINREVIPTDVLARLRGRDGDPVG